jgi:quinol monooxygenase YgiN
MRVTVPEEAAIADVTKALYVRLEAKEGREGELTRFLEGALELAEGEADTPAWFAIKMGPATFGIFDVFADDAARDAHLNGPIAAALMEKAPELLSEPPRIERVDVLAAKLPR